MSSLWHVHALAGTRRLADLLISDEYAGWDRSPECIASLREELVELRRINDEVEGGADIWIQSGKDRQLFDAFMVDLEAALEAWRDMIEEGTEPSAAAWLAAAMKVGWWHVQIAGVMGSEQSDVVN